MPHADPAESKAYHAKRYRENREAILARVKKRAEEKRDEILVYMRNRYAENADEINAKTRADRAEDPEKFRKADRDRHAKNPEVKRASGRRAYQRNKEQKKARANQYRIDNPDARADAQQRRRAKKAGAKIERVLRADILERDGPSCAMCGVETIQPVYAKPIKNERHYDHIVPLCRGGSHSMDNMRILCAGCNLRKHTRLDSELEAIEGL